MHEAAAGLAGGHACDLGGGEGEWRRGAGDLTGFAEAGWGMDVLSFCLLSAPAD